MLRHRRPRALAHARIAIALDTASCAALVDKLCTRDDCPELIFYHKGRIVRKQLNGRPSAQEIADWAVKLEQAVRQGGSATLAAIDAQNRAQGYGAAAGARGSGKQQDMTSLLNQVLGGAGAGGARGTAQQQYQQQLQQAQQARSNQMASYGGGGSGGNQMAQYGGGGQQLMGVSQVYEDLDGDGIADALHEDLDGDGIADIVHEDIDGDGIADLLHEDSDGDGILDSVHEVSGAAYRGAAYRGAA